MAKGLQSSSQKSTRVTRLALVELRHILSGRISNWSQLGGSDAPVNIGIRRESVFFAIIPKHFFDSGRSWITRDESGSRRSFRSRRADGVVQRLAQSAPP